MKIFIIVLGVVLMIIGVFMVKKGINQLASPPEVFYSNGHSVNTGYSETKDGKIKFYIDGEITAPNDWLRYVLEEEKKGNYIQGFKEKENP